MNSMNSNNLHVLCTEGRWFQVWLVPLLPDGIVEAAGVACELPTLVLPAHHVLTVGCWKQSVMVDSAVSIAN
jgi:hypothetical protein